MDEDGKKMSRKKLRSVRQVAIEKGVLTHEVDEGSRCINCGDSCPGFSLHFWRKVCKNCLCPREDHDINDEGQHAQTVGRILFSPTAETANSLHKKLSEWGPPSHSPRSQRSISLQEHPSYSPSVLRKTQNYLWMPKASSLEAAKAYFLALPAAKTPIKGTPGERYRQKQHIRQLPSYDIDIFWCNNLSAEEKKQMELFLKIRREKSLGRGEIKMKDAKESGKWACEECKIPLKVGEVAVFAERVGVDKYWHPACFTCADCHELLVDLIYFYSDKLGKIYCGRHHAETLKPRCAACDELILCREYTRAEEQDWHLDHFCCLRCDKELGGKQYRPQDGMPYCLSCYEIAFSNLCETCGKVITLDEPRLSHENQVWHGTPSCFRCGLCKRSLVDAPFLPKFGLIFCSKEHSKKYKEKH